MTGDEGRVSIGFVFVPPGAYACSDADAARDRVIASHDGLDGDDAAERLAATGHQRGSGARDEHGVERVVERRGLADHGQVGLDALGHPGQALELAAARPADGALAAVDDDGVLVAAGLVHALQHGAGLLAGRARDGRGELDVPHAVEAVSCFSPAPEPMKFSTNSFAGSARIRSGVSYCTMCAPSVKITIQSPSFTASSKSCVT